MGWSLLEQVSWIKKRVAVRRQSLGRWRARKRAQRKIKRGEYRLVEGVCCLCGPADLEVLGTRELYGFPVSMGYCRQCGLGVLTPRLNNEALEAFYQQEYRQLKFGIIRRNVIASEFARGRRRGRYIDGFLQEQGISLEGQRVVEVGCGPGGILHWFAERGADVTGCDLDPEIVAYGQQQGLQIVSGDMDMMLKADRRFDIMVLSHVLEHVPSPVDFLLRARRMLKTSGCLYVEVPGLNDPRANLTRLVQIVHLYYFTLDTIKICLRRAGFNLEYGNEVVQALSTVTYRQDDGFMKAPPQSLLHRLLNQG